MVERVLRAGAGACPDEIALVVGPETSAVSAISADATRVIPVIQDPPRGTGDAVRLALAALPGIDRVVVLYSDHPLLQPETVAALLEGSRAPGAKVAILTARLPDAAGYGRIVRDEGGQVIRIAERRDDDPDQRRGETEINSGMMALDAHWARAALQALQPSAASGELYLTDLVALATRGARPGDPWPVVAVTGSPDDAQGVNDRGDLARADARALERIRQRHMAAGVTMRLPETILIEEDVQIAADTQVLPHSQITGHTAIGNACIIGPSAIIADAHLGDRVVVRSSTVEDSRIADDSDVGPYAHLRGGCEIGPRVHIGNFAELKNARLAAGVKVGHFSYLGDAAVGAEANIGAGTVTANFDGERKHGTEIGAGAFIGSDTILRAPVRVGDRARTGAGSVVTKDVADGATVVGVPARMVRRAVVERDEQFKER
jgi:bifunctional UDP-N-acetylglucosamine pyrophosphorylase/glucosamine-1-phosphate N-acetyltransferase